jgi:hypothetical protein
MVHSSNKNNSMTKKWLSLLGLVAYLACPGQTFTTAAGVSAEAVKKREAGEVTAATPVQYPHISRARTPRLPKDYYWMQMNNGLEVVVIENHKVPLATIEIAVKNGSYTEGPEYSGLSHLFEHMFFKANKDYPDQEKFIQRTEELGMIWNGTTGDERVNYFFTFDKDSLAAGPAIHECSDQVPDLPDRRYAEGKAGSGRRISAG